MTEDNPARTLQEELRSLERRAQSVRREQGRACSRNAAIQISGLSKQTVSGWFSTTSPRVPKNPDDLWQLVSTYSSWAKETARHAFWNTLWDRASSAINDTPKRTLGRKINEWPDPFALEVHQSIDISGENHGLSLLPTYIRRPHDDQLDEVISRASSGDNVMAVLVGESSTGKTRACWEAVHKLPDTWNLWHPINPGHAESLLNSLREGIPPKTVLWLNETQLYLQTPASSFGELVAAHLRELIRDSTTGPVLILGTMWPRHWDNLTRNPVPGTEDEHPQTRTLLANSVISVPSNFSRESLTKLQGIIKEDPRLAEAYRMGKGPQIRLTQFLAGAPAQMERYEKAPEASRAIIDSAIDLRRFGHGPALPEAVLRKLAEASLDTELLDLLDPDWFEVALDYALVPCRGVSGPLRRVRRTARSQITEAAYQLSDYVEQVGRSARATIFPPAELVSVALQHIHDIEQIRAIASSLDKTGRSFYAAQLYLRAMQLGDYESGRSLAEALEFAEDLDGALEVARYLQENTDPNGSEELAYYLYRNNQSEEAEELCIEEFEKGNPKPWIKLRQAYDLDDRTGAYEDLGSRILSRKLPELYFYITTFGSKDSESRRDELIVALARRLQVSHDEAKKLLSEEIVAIEPRLELFARALEEHTEELKAATVRLNELAEKNRSGEGVWSETKRIHAAIADHEEKGDFGEARKEITKGLDSALLGLETLGNHLSKYDPSVSAEAVERYGVDWETRPISAWKLADVRRACQEALD